MTFKTILQALEGGLKFIDVTQNFRLFYLKKKVTKFVRFQILKVAYMHTEK